MSARAAWCALLVLAACGRAPHPAAPRPNVVLVLADDQRYDTLGCTGNTAVETPAIDSLARDGVLFRRAYVVTSLCCPARATLLTGRYAHETGIRDNDDHGPFLGGAAGFPERLQQVGYETAFVGKWHIENPGARPQPGFDHWVSFEGQGRYEGETYDVDGRTERPAGFSTDVLAEHAVAFLERPHERPFCLILSVKNLHGPYLPPERHRRKLVRAAFPPPASAQDPDDVLPAYVRHARTTPRNKTVVREGQSATRLDYVRGYHQLLYSLDEAVARVLAALDRTGRARDTLVVYTSDGGFLWGEHGLYKKRAAYEPSIQVPLLLRWPDALPAGHSVDSLALNVDLAATILAVAGADAPADLPGRDLRDALAPAAEPAWRTDFLYVDAWDAARDGPYELAVVGERFKYVRYRWGAIEELLVDRAADPDERVDLAADPAHAAILEASRERMRALLAEARAPATWMDPLPPGDDAADDD